MYSVDIIGRTDDDYDRHMIWGLDRSSKPFILRVENFPHFFYAELPLFENKRPIRWDTDQAQDVYRALAAKMHNKGEEILPFKKKHFAMKPKMYYHGKPKYPTLLLSFKTRVAMDMAVNMLRRPLYVYEENDVTKLDISVWEDCYVIPQTNKLMVARNVYPTSWISFKGTRVSFDDSISKLHNEYIVDWTTIDPVPLDICENWQANPGKMAIDIETYCDNHKQFPDKWIGEHVAYMISCIYQREGSDIKYRYAIIMGKYLPITKEKISGLEIFEVKTEEELVRMMAAIIDYHDPDILTGFNIMGFDYAYLNARLERNFRKWPIMGRLKGESAVVVDGGWSSRAHGYIRTDHLYSPGRISIDLMRVIKATHTLNAYSLNECAMHFLGETKHPIKSDEMFAIYERMVLMTTILTKASEVTVTSPFDDIVKTIEWSIAYNECLADISRVIEYCIQDSELVLKIIDKIYMWIAMNEMSNVVDTMPYELYTRGQQMKCISQIYRAASGAGYIVDSKPVSDIPYVGGLVRAPIPGFHEYVMVFDFSGMYPSIIRAYNLCYTTLIPNKAKVSRENCHVMALETGTEEVEENEDSDPEENGDEEEPIPGMLIEQPKYQLSVCLIRLSQVSYLVS